MINPYAQAFMIATRTDHVAPPRLRAAKDETPQRKFRLFSRRPEVSDSDI